MEKRITVWPKDVFIGEYGREAFIYTLTESGALTLSLVVMSMSRGVSPSAAAELSMVPARFSLSNYENMIHKTPAKTQQRGKRRGGATKLLVNKIVWHIKL